MESQLQKKLILTIPFNNNQQVLLVSEVLKVDKEFKGSGIQRILSAEQNNLIVSFEGADYKKLRSSINAFLKNIILIVKTIQSFSIV
ncbi:jg5567 [Pararge aegeria aegeria]|uniref:L antigen family member 3 n=1 Tax=Pararge aegeria aegeria TaxID=348720 RepID=A0A8S4RLA1_9NEOP|nr:jg5567 [Pararge aegeria aegeria]